MEIELDVAHERERNIFNELIRSKAVHQSSPEIQPMEPVNPRAMSFKEAARRVREFEKTIRDPVKQIEELDNASEISKAISDDAGGRARSEGEGRAV